jgi:hypothetical protein
VVPVRSVHQFLFLTFLHFYDSVPGHIHGFLWLTNAIDVDALNWSDANNIEAICTYFSRLITASNADPLRARPQYDCLFKDLLPPVCRDLWNFEDDHVDLSNRCQKDGVVIGGHRRCVPSQCFRSGTCRFGFPYRLTANPVAFIERINTGNPRKRFLSRT